MRAAAEDFRMARVLGIRADTVVAAAFALSGRACGASRRSCSRPRRDRLADHRPQHRPVRVHRHDRRRDGQPARCGARRVLDRRPDRRAPGDAPARPPALPRRLRLCRRPRRRSSSAPRASCPPRRPLHGRCLAGADCARAPRRRRHPRPRTRPLALSDRALARSRRSPAASSQRRVSGHSLP